MIEKLNRPLVWWWPALAPAVLKMRMADGPIMTMNCRELFACVVPLGRGLTSPAMP